MTQHLHSEFVSGCFRCELSRDEVNGLRFESDEEFLAYLESPDAARGRS